MIFMIKRTDDTLYKEHVMTGRMVLSIHFCFYLDVDIGLINYIKSV